VATLYHEAVVPSLIGPVHRQEVGADYYYHGDDVGNVMAVTDGSGAVVERYDYLDYGGPRIFSPEGAPLNESAIGNVHLLGGQRYDAEIRWYYTPGGYADPLSGRRTSVAGRLDLDGDGIDDAIDNPPKFAGSVMSDLGDLRAGGPGFAGSVLGDLGH
jgi:hypothetical protein